MNLDPSNVPIPVRRLLPLAEVWGIGDDYDRETLIEQASLEELTAVVDAVDGVPDGDLYGWLAGPEAAATDPTREYVAMTNLTMVADHARIILRRAGHGEPSSDIQRR
jgi:hypothetical protein